MITLPPLRPGRAPPAELAQLRGQMQAAAAAGAWKTAEPPVQTSLAGLRTLRFKPKGIPVAYMLQFHGGGFRLGMPEFESSFAEALAQRLGIEVVVPQYRLAPEGPFPAGLIDAVAALEALRDEVGEAKLIVGGDSAGGGLAAALCVLAAARGRPRIDGLVLLSPWLDLRVSAKAYAVNAATDPMFSKQAADLAAELYLQGFDPAHPLASPLLAPIGTFPPTLISVGTGEVLYDDSRLFHDKLTASGAASTLIAVPGMEHVAVVRSLIMAGAAETLAAVTVFIDAVTAG